MEGEVFDFLILAVDRHSGYIVPFPRKKSKRKDKRDRHRLGMQAKIVTQAMARHWLTVFDVPAVICSDRGTQFVRACFRTMCKYVGVRHAKTLAYHSHSNRRAEVVSSEVVEKFRQLDIEEPGRNWYHSLWRVLQAYHDLPEPSVLSPHRILFLRERVSRTLPRLIHGSVASEANAIMSQADDTAKKVCEAMVAEHAKMADHPQSRGIHKYRLKDTVWVQRHHKDVLSRHQQQSWYIPRVILRKKGQDVYVMQVENNRTVERDHTLLLPLGPDPHGCAVTFEFTADAFDSDTDGEENEYTTKRILSDKPDPRTPGERLYNV